MMEYQDFPLEKQLETTSKEQWKLVYRLSPTAQWHMARKGDVFSTKDEAREMQIRLMESLVGAGNTHIEISILPIHDL